MSTAVKPKEYSDLDQHDEDHDVWGNQSEANFWRGEK